MVRVLSVILTLAIGLCRFRRDLLLEIWHFGSNLLS